MRALVWRGGTTTSAVTVGALFALSGQWFLGLAVCVWPARHGVMATSS